MKIQGLKQLDQNSYDSISISEDRAVISGKEIKTVPLMARFSDELRGKTDKEIQNLIVDQFLDYSRISYVSDDYSRLRGNVVYAGTEPGRLLILNDVADEEMKAKILEKYILIWNMWDCAITEDIFMLKIKVSVIYLSLKARR